MDGLKYTVSSKNMASGIVFLSNQSYTRVIAHGKVRYTFKRTPEVVRASEILMSGRSEIQPRP